MAKVPFWHLVCSVIKKDNLLARTRESQMLSVLQSTGHAVGLCPDTQCKLYMSEAGCREEQPRAPVSSPCVSAMPHCRMANAPMDTPDQSAHLHRMPAESPLDMLLRHPCFPSEIALGMTARQPNSESLTAILVAAMRRNSCSMGRLLKLRR